MLQLGSNLGIKVLPKNTLICRLQECGKARPILRSEEDLLKVFLHHLFIEMRNKTYVLTNMKLNRGGREYICIIKYIKYHIQLEKVKYTRLGLPGCQNRLQSVSLLKTISQLLSRLADVY